MFGIETALEIRSKNAIPTKTYENGSFVLLFESGKMDGRQSERKTSIGDIPSNHPV